MTSPDGESTTVRNRKNAVREEQLLCNEALQSSEFDDISDNDWVAMCEQAAATGRHTNSPGVPSPEAAPEPGSE